MGLIVEQSDACYSSLASSLACDNSMNQAFAKHMIRDWRRDDASSIAKYANNRKIWLNLRDAFPYPYATTDAEAFLTTAMQSVPRTFFAIATETEAIGSIALMPGKDVHRFTAELGYWLGEPFWGKEIMTEAVRAMSEYAFEDLGLIASLQSPILQILPLPESAREGWLRL
jgi:ribosomal-protein-alanine N-acetyltransferase